MIVGGVNAATVANAVWTNATRSLTTDVPTYTSISVANGTLAALTVLDIRPAAGKFRFVTIVDMGAGSGNLTPGSYDGTTFTAESSVGTLVTPALIANPSNIGIVVKNTVAAQTRTYTLSGWDEA